jgi:hypothetical protein
MIKFNKILRIITLLSFIFIVLAGCGSYNELPPKIKYGEFPFELKYELNEKIYDINDTVICDFGGFDISGGFGKFRTWNEHLKSGSHRFTIILNKNVNSVLEPGRVNKSSEVYFDYGDGKYYMDHPDGAIHSSPHFCYVETYDKSPKETHVDATPLTKEQLQKYFGIKIIEWTFSEPIKNTFE